jgi:hypothetical protein
MIAGEPCLLHLSRTTHPTITNATSPHLPRPWPIPPAHRGARPLCGRKRRHVARGRRSIGRQSTTTAVSSSRRANQSGACERTFARLPAVFGQNGQNGCGANATTRGSKPSSMAWSRSSHDSNPTWRPTVADHHNPGKVRCPLNDGTTALAGKPRTAPRPPPPTAHAAPRRQHPRIPAQRLPSGQASRPATPATSTSTWRGMFAKFPDKTPVRFAVITPIRGP